MMMIPGISSHQSPIITTTNTRRRSEQIGSITQQCGSALSVASTLLQHFDTASAAYNMKERRSKALDVDAESCPYTVQTV